MSRSRKLIIVGLVLATGLALAWPFRKTGEEKNYEAIAESSSSPILSTPSLDAPATAPSSPVELPSPQLGSPAPHVTAKMASMAENTPSGVAPPATASFDLANHPALVSMPLRQAAAPVTPPVPPVSEAADAAAISSVPPQTSGDAQPAYQTIQPDRVFDAAEQRPEEIRHVVQNSDTLEKLARRYLGDEGRALEIFDLNRDVLDNPHLLPINAELRIPADAQITIE